MVLLRNSTYTSAFRVQAYRTARARAAGQSWRQIGRRSYASGHEGAKKASSDLPWLIGSVAVTVPSATWLWQQGPKKSKRDAHHGHASHDEQKEDGGEEQEGQEKNNSNPEETNDEKPQDTEDSRQANGVEEGDDTKDKRDDGGEEKEAKGEEDKRPIGETIRNEPPNEISPSENKWSSGDEGLKEGDNDAVQKKSQQIKSVDADADEGKKDGPSANIDKGHEGEEKGTRVTEGDKKRKAEDPRSNSMNPNMADERKSKKPEGVVDTAKITGTVDVNRPLR